MTTIWQTLNATLDPAGFFALVETTLDGFVSIVDELAEVVIILSVVAAVVLVVTGGAKRLIGFLKIPGFGQ